MKESGGEEGEEQERGAERGREEEVVKERSECIVAVDGDTLGSREEGDERKRSDD